MNLDNNNDKDVRVSQNGVANGDVTKANGHSNGLYVVQNGDALKQEAPKMATGSYVRGRLSWRQRGSYSLGHVFNDLCASMWFSYALIFYTHVLGFSSGNAGTLFLIGQVADAVSTPFVGLASDKRNDMAIFRYGRRKAWHAIGSVCVTVSFPFLFIKCLGCDHSYYSLQMVYFASFIILFQFGWASVQVAHLSLIPDLSKTPSDRTELSAYRNAFTAIASICVYSIAWIILGDSSGTVSIRDEVSFRNLALIVSAIGVVFTIAFHIGVREPELPPKVKVDRKGAAEVSVTLDPEQQVISADQACGTPIMTWKTWLKTCEFYKIGLLYMCTRLFCNLSQTYIPFYLQDTLMLKPDSIAYIPLVNYVSGFLASLVMRKMNKKVGRTISFVVGAVIALCFCFWVFFGHGPSFSRYQIYGVAVVMGIGGNVMLVTCLGITADLIGDNNRTGAFVYGAMSFADKLSNGVVVAIVQNLDPANSFYRDMLAFGCGAPALVALVTVLTVKQVDQKTPKPSLADAVTPYVIDTYTQKEERF